MEKRTPEGLARRREQRRLRKKTPEGKAASLKFRNANKDRLNAKAREAYQRDRERVLAKISAKDRASRAAIHTCPRPPRKPSAVRQSEYRHRHPEKVKGAIRRYQAENPDKIKTWRRAAHHRGMKDPVFVVTKRLRSRLADEVRFRARKTIKFASALTLVGCTRAELVAWIEKQFRPGMTWENRAEWHIDHIKPICSFDMMDLVEQNKAFHFSNLQPLWRSENCRKGAKLVYIRA